MSALTSSIVAAWSGVSTYANASSSSRCHGVSGPNACPAVAMRAEYSRMSSAAISLTAFLARPLVLAQSPPPILDRLGASPPTYLVTWSSWSLGTKSRSPGWPRLLRRVLDHQVLARRRVGARADGPLHQLDEPPDPVLLVHHVVVRAQLQRVDDVAAPARHPAHVPGRRPRAAGEVRLGEHREVQRLGDEAGADGRGHDEHDAALGLVGRSLPDQPRRDLGGLELLDHALRGTVPLGGQHQPPAGLLQHAHVGDRAGDLAAVALDVPRGDHEGAAPSRPGRRPSALACGASFRAAVWPVPVRALVEVVGLRRPPWRRRPGRTATASTSPARARPRARGSPRTTRSVAADRSSGVAAPAAADVHAASRNSCVVATRSCARRRTRSGSTSTSRLSSGTRSSTGHHALDERGRERLHALDRDARPPACRACPRPRAAAGPARRHAPAPRR